MSGDQRVNREVGNGVALARRSLLFGLPAMLSGFARQVRITDVQADVLRFPPGRPIADAIQTLGVERGGCVVRVLTDAGVTGWAYSSWGRLAGGPRVVQAIVLEELKPALLGRDPTMPKAIRRDLWRHVDYQGVQGVTQFALAAVDIALWDILGKLAGQPVYKLLGAVRDRMPVYSMAGWYYEKDGDLSAFRASLQDAFEEGFRAVKIKVGRGTLDEDVRRIRVAQEIAGPGRRVLVDANQALTLNEAIRRGRAYQELGCFWYEEPMPPHEKGGYATLARELDIRVATGENEYTRHAFADLIERRAADVLQPDNRRAGGVTEWMEIAALADAAGLEIASHGGGPTNMHMLLAMPNAIYMETGSLRNETSHLEALRMRDGEVLAPETPGMGSELRPDWVAKHRV